MVIWSENPMVEQRRGNHPITRLTVHLVWVTKYRYQILKGEIQKRCRELIMQICDGEGCDLYPIPPEKTRILTSMTFTRSIRG